MQLTRVQYWFLDVVLHDSVGLSALLPLSDWGGLDIQRPALGLSAEEMVEEIFPLLNHGYICAIGPEIQNQPTREQLLAGFRNRLDCRYIVSYRLTTKGGSVWEEYSSPCWEHYLYGEIHETERVLRCASREFIQEFISKELLIPNWDGFLFYCPIPETEIWTEISPWKVNYWKTLPHAYEVRYQIVHKDPDSIDNSIPLTEEQEQAVQFIYSVYHVDSWYHNYFKLGAKNE